jgi:hypothetical protein
MPDPAARAHPIVLPAVLSILEASPGALLSTHSRERSATRTGEDSNGPYRHLPTQAVVVGPFSFQAPCPAVLGSQSLAAGGGASISGSGTGAAPATPPCRGIIFALDL